ncbi:MAG: hypothetical protein E7523_06390 [Ruminococcaceae bacterium]|nr:hypothetical protein [Oscillospiraceae bacterium]
MSVQKKFSVLQQRETQKIPAVLCYVFPLLVFGGDLIYCIASGSFYPVSGYYLIHYLYTYDHGFVARGLVGEVISWFVPMLTNELTKTIMIVSAVLLMLAVSLWVGKTLCSAREDKLRFQTVLFLIVVFFMLAAPIDFYYTDFKLDKYLWMLTFLAVFLTDYKVGIWFVPLICVVATLINPVFLFCSMVFVAIILLQKFYENSYSTKNGIICGIAYIAMIALGIYAPISEKKLGFTDARELLDFYFARHATPLVEADYNLFANEWLMDYFDPMEDYFSLAYEIYFKDWGNGKRVIACFLFMVIPAGILLLLFWCKVIKNEKNKMQQFIYFLCAITPVVTFLAIILSWELFKYFGNNLLVQIGLIVYFVSKGTPAVVQTVREVTDYCKKHLLLSGGTLFYILTLMAVFGSRH